MKKFQARGRNAAIYFEWEREQGRRGERKVASPLRKLVRILGEEKRGKHTKVSLVGGGGEEEG